MTQQTEELQRLKTEKERTQEGEKAEVEQLRARVHTLDTRGTELLVQLEESQRKIQELKVSSEKEVEVWMSRLEQLQREMERMRGTEQMDGQRREGEQTEQQLSSLLKERDESNMLLQQKEKELFDLRQRTEELSRDRDRVRLALEKTEAALIGYRERAHQQEQSQDGGTDTEQGPLERLMVLQQLVANLELEQNRLNQKNSRLQNQNKRLRDERTSLRDTLREVDQRSSTQQHKSEVSSCQYQESQGLSTEEERLRAMVRTLEDQVDSLRISMALDHQQKVEFIEQSSRNSQCLQSLYSDLSASLSVVSHQTTPTVLQIETQRLDQSFREEELRMSLIQS